MRLFRPSFIARATCSAMGVLIATAGLHAGPRYLVTELLSNEDSENTEDYWELTNVGDAAGDLTGWSWDDNSETPGTVAIPDNTMIAAGESMIFTKMEATAFRTWWGLADTVQVITGASAPGLGGGDGVFLYDESDALVASFSYDAGNFVLSDGSDSLGGHAGPSAGGSVDWQAAVLDPTFGYEAPRYTVADGATNGTFVSTLSETEFGSPGYSGLFAAKLVVTEVLSNQEFEGGEDYWELTNVGNATARLENWSWDDDSETPGINALPLVEIAPRESVVFTSLDASAFRSWWELSDSVQVIDLGSEAPGLGKGDGVYIYNESDELVASLSYAEGAVTLVDGSATLGDHAGLSAGGSSAWQAMVLDGMFGFEEPRYTFADGATRGTRFSSGSTEEAGSPGYFFQNLVITELLSNQDSDGTEDYWELTNVGSTTVSLENWSWDDDSQLAGTVAIPSGVSIAAGESAIFTSMEAEAFRSWWGLDGAVQVISDADAPGFGKGDAVFLFDSFSNLVATFSYAAGGFTKSDGSDAQGEHAGPSAGGSADWQAVVIDPSFGPDAPRYTFADGASNGSFASTLSETEFGSPGFAGLGTSGGTGVELIALTLTIEPATFSENAGSSVAIGTVTRSGSTDAELVVSLASNDSGEASVAATVTIAAGQASATFAVDAVDDSFPDGSQVVTITATAEGAMPGVSNELTVTDDGDVLTTSFMLTEIQSNQSDLAPSGAEDFWELTNFGEAAEDISGFSWHDSGRNAASAAAWALPEGTMIGAGESVVFTEADPATFRAWWGLAESVKVFQSVGAPGLGKNDGISFFDEGGNELFFFSYAAGGFVREGGSDSLGEHAGPSGGGVSDWDSLIWVPSSGTESPRYVAATGSNYASFQAASPATDFGSPGNRGVVVPTVSFSSASVVEGDSGTTALTLEVTRSHSDTAFTVAYAVTGGTAVAGDDFASLPAGVVNFALDGAATATIEITVNGDEIAEADETVEVTLSDVVNTGGETMILTAVGVGTIENDDPFAPVIVSQPEDASVAAGGFAILSVEVSALPEASFQWYRGESGDVESPVSGATQASLTTPNLEETTRFWVRASNSEGHADSEVATVMVLAPISMVDLSTYVRVGRYDLPEPKRTALPAGTPTHNLLAQEVSGVAYNWDTDTLFLVGDGGRSVTQVTKTGVLVDTMTLALGTSPQGTAFYDPEGITYVGGGVFVFSEERDRQLVRFTYAAGTTLTREDTQTVKLGTYVDNTGTEGLSYDPLTGGFVVLKEISPIGIFQTTVDFDAGTASNGSPTTENSTNLFDPALLGMSDVADVFALSNLPAFAGKAQEGNLLVIGQEDARIVNIDRSGTIHSSLQIVSDVGNPLSVGNQQHEGLTMDRLGNLYVVSENGGGGIDYPQLWVYAPSSEANQAPTEVTVNNAVTLIKENTSTASRLKLGEIVVIDDGLGQNQLSVSGDDAAFFQIDGTELYLVAGTKLDFETKNRYSVTIEVDDASVGATPDASVAFAFDVSDVEPEVAGPSALIISEIAPWSSGESPVGADWFELSNTSDNPIELAGWKVDDGSMDFGSAAALQGVASIAPGESVIFVETEDLAATKAVFLAHWFGEAEPEELQIGSYSGSGLGLSSSGDGVAVFDANGTLQTSVSFGASPSAAPFGTFDNTLGIDGGEVTRVSEVGVNGAFAAAGSAGEIGSPGYAAPGLLVISEVAPWSSGNSAVGADWFEVTNVGSRAVSIDGWKVDDGSESPAAAVALIGVTVIAPGESVVFVEYDASLEAMQVLFAEHWFGGIAPSGLQIGGYTGSGIGLSTGGDAVNLYDSRSPTPMRRASVSFGASPSSAPYATFDNAVGLDLETLTQLSEVGVRGGFVAAGSVDEIGSPGSIANVSYLTAFNQWLSDNGYTSVSLYGDTDKNGVSDLLEYFYNQSPNDPRDTGNLPRFVASGDVFAFSFGYNESSVFEGRLQVSSDLTEWADAVEGTDYEILETQSLEGTMRVRYQILAGDRDGVFVRLAIEE